MTVNSSFSQLRTDFIQSRVIYSKFDSLFSENSLKAVSIDNCLKPAIEKLKDIESLDLLTTAFLSEHSTDLIPAKPLLEFFLIIIETIHEVDLIELDMNSIKNLLSELNTQVANSLFFNPETLSQKLREVKPSESFTLLLPYQKKGGLHVKNIVEYQRNQDQTYNITLYQLNSQDLGAVGASESLNSIRRFPYLFYKSVPESEIFGGEVALHFKELCTWLDAKEACPSSVTAIFNPFNSYLDLKKTPFTRRVTGEHAHALKAFSAFIYDKIEPNENPSKASLKEIKLEKISKYKALIGLSKLLLANAFYISINKQTCFNLDEYLQKCFLGSLSVKHCASYVLKLKNNPYFQKIYPLASLQLDLMSEELDQNLRSYFLIEKNFSMHVKNNQKILNFSKLLGNHFSQFQPTFQDKMIAWDAYFNPISTHPKKITQNLDDLFKFVETQKALYPSICLSRLLTLFSQLPLPSETNFWNQISVEDCKKLCRILKNFSKTLSNLAFQQEARFSLRVHNQAAKLALIQYYLAEKIEPDLNKFHPAIFNFLTLYKAYDFRWDDLTDFKEYQAIHFASLSHHSIQILAFGSLLGGDNDLADWVRSKSPDIDKILRDSSVDHLLGANGVLIANLLEMSSASSKVPDLKLRGKFFDLLKDITQLNAHVSILSNSTALAQKGTQNYYDFDKAGGWRFDLSYAKTRGGKFNIFAKEYAQLHLKLEDEEANLFSRSNQNDTIKRLENIQSLEKREDARLFEESSSHKGVMIPQLLVELKRQPHLIYSEKFQEKIERYLFDLNSLAGEQLYSTKVDLRLNDELHFYPEQHQLFLSEFLSSLKMPLLKILNEWLNNTGAIPPLFSLLFRLESISSQELLQTQFKDLFGAMFSILKTESKNCEKNSFKQFKIDFLFLKMSHHQSKDKEGNFSKEGLAKEGLTKEEWEEYLHHGIRFQSLFEQQTFVLNYSQSLFWTDMRLQRAEAFRNYTVTNPEKASLILSKAFSTEAEKWNFSNFPICSSEKIRDFNFLILATGSENTLEIDSRIKEDPDFIRLFQKRVNYWKKGSEDVELFTFTDPRDSILYHVLNDPLAPSLLIYRFIDEIKYYYCPQQFLSEKSIPLAVVDEAAFWVSETGITLGYHLNDAKTIWLKSNAIHQLFFQSGVEKGSKLEYAQKVKEKSYCLEHYATFSIDLSKISDTASSEVKFLVYPYIKTGNRGGLIFENVKGNLVLHDNPNKSLVDSEFQISYGGESYNTKHKVTPIRLEGLVFEEIVQEHGSTKEPKSILVPFVPHTAAPNSTFVRFLAPNQVLEFNSIEMIEIPFHKRGLDPKTPQQILFSAYVSLVGKDYYEALRFLKKIRTNASIGEKERKILKWLIESGNETEDHSSLAAAVKLRAYFILGTLGMSLVEKISTQDIPVIPLDTLYLEYMHHIGAISSKIKISGEIEDWILSFSIERFYSNKHNKSFLSFSRLIEAKKRQASLLHAAPEINPTPLLKKWKIPFPYEEDAYEISESVIQSILKPQETPYLMIPGYPYNELYFSQHYQSLSQYSKATSQWALIHQLETVVIPLKLKRLLQVAYIQQEKASPLPDLSTVKTYERKAVFDAWSHKQLISLDQEMLKPKKTGLITYASPLRNKTPLLINIEKAATEKTLLDPLQAAYNQHKSENSIIPFYAEIKKFFSQNELPTEFPILKSPFQKANLSSDYYSQKKVFEYEKEWNQGMIQLERLAQVKEPTPNAIVALQYFSFDLMHLRDDQNRHFEIERQLNRTPIDPSIRSNIHLVNASQNKIYIKFDDAITIFLTHDDGKKLKALQKFNPHLTLQDIKILNDQFTIYFELDNFFRAMNQTKILLSKIYCKEKGKEKDEYQWSSPSDFEKAKDVWPEVAKIFNITPGSIYSNPSEQQSLEQLIFEHLCGYRLRKDQTDILQAVVEKIFSDDPDISISACAFQLLMGGGKTTVILALLAKIASQKNYVPVICSHHSQEIFLKDFFGNTQFTRLHQDVVILDYQRDHLNSVGILKEILNKLERAKDKKRLVIMTTTLRRILSLEFQFQMIHFANPKSIDPDIEKKVHLLAKINTFFTQNALILSDEVDLNNGIMEEINVPLGESVKVSQNTLKTIQVIYQTIGSNPAIAPQLQLSEDKQTNVLNTLTTEIFPLLVNELINTYSPLTIILPPEELVEMRDSLKNYLLGTMNWNLQKGIQTTDKEEDGFLEEIKFSSEENKEQAKRDLHFLKHLHGLKNRSEEEMIEGLRAVTLTSGLIKTILSIVLAKNHDKDYGFSKTNIFQIIRYLGTNAPAKTTVGNIYEACSYFFQGALNQGLSSAQFLKYQAQTRDAAWFSAESFHIPLDQTQEAKNFEALIGIPLFKEMTTDELNILLKTLNQDIETLLHIYFEIGQEELSYHPELMQNNATCIPKLGKKFVACSGTFWNRNTWPRELATHCLMQEGSEGMYLVKPFLDFNKKNLQLFTVDTVSATSLLKKAKEINPAEKFANTRAIMDAAGLLKALNEDVAREILTLPELKEEIDAVVFYDNAEKTFAILKREHEVIPLKNLSAQTLKQHCLPDKIFVYYDQLRTTGLDCNLKNNARAILTFNPNTTDLRSYMQGLGRERKYFENQTFDIAVPKDALKGLGGFDESNPEKSLTLENVVNSALRNQNNTLKVQLFRSAQSQIKELFKGAVDQKLQKLILKNEDVSKTKALELITLTKWLFIASFDDDPIKLFLNLDEEMEVYEVVQKTFEKIKSRFLNTAQSFFNPKELQNLEKEALPILEWAKESLTWKMINQSDDLSFGTEVQTQTQTQLEMELNLDLNKEMQKELQKYQNQIVAPTANTIYPEVLKEFPKGILDYSLAPILTLNDLFRKVHYEAPYENIFPADLMMSENLSKTYETDLAIFHSAQKKMYHVLVMKENDGYRFLYIDLAEAEFWRREIRSQSLPDCWLVDLEGHSLNDRHPIPEDVTPLLNRQLWWGHFFNGNVHALRLRPHLIATEFKKENYALKYRFLQVRTANNPTQSKILNLDPIINDKEDAQIVFGFDSKTQEDQWKKENIYPLSKEALNKLPDHFVRFFADEQIPLIEKKGFFKYLPEEKFLFVKATQVHLIPDVRLKCLRTKEQITALPRRRILWLKGDSLKQLPEDLLPYINVNESVHLPEPLQIRLQKDWIKKEGLEKFAQRLPPQLASIVLPECVPHLLSSVIPFLTKKEQIAVIKEEQMRFLKASQFHLLPKDKWKLLTEADLRKCSLEPTLTEESKEFIQQIDIDWINRLDPRLASFFTSDQVNAIQSESFLPYLDEDQLVHIDPKFADLLSEKQVKQLDSRHPLLIQQLTQLGHPDALSPEAVPYILDEQVPLLTKREQILKLSSKQRRRLLPHQVKLLDLSEQKDRLVIKDLTINQFKDFDDKTVALYVFYLSNETLNKVHPRVFQTVESLPKTLQQNLNAAQLQEYLRGNYLLKKDLMPLIESITEAQWNSFDKGFVSQFFIDLTDETVSKVPASRVEDLKDPEFKVWHHLNKTETRARNAAIGLFALIFFPLTALAAIFSIPFGIKNFKKIVALPLLLISPLSYYRRFR